MERKLFALVLTLSFLYIISPLLFPLALGGVFAVLFMPWVEKLERKKVPTAAAALAVTVVFSLLVLLPTSLLVEQGVESAVKQLKALHQTPPAGVDWAEAVVRSSNAHQAVTWMSTVLPVSVDQLSDTVTDLLRGTSNRITEWLGDLLARLPGLAMALMVIVISLYFFLLDGRKLTRLARRHSFFTAAQTERLLDSLEGVCRSVVLAALVSGSCQALFEMAVVLSTGTPEVMLIGMLVFVSSFIPLVGAAPVTFGLAVREYVTGRSTPAIVLLGAALVIVAMDNVIRPWFLKGRANLHPLITFSAAIGGLQMLGFPGIFLGPIVAALLVATFHVLTDAEPAH